MSRETREMRPLKVNNKYQNELLEKILVSLSRILGGRISHKVKVLKLIWKGKQDLHQA